MVAFKGMCRTRRAFFLALCILSFQSPDAAKAADDIVFGVGTHFAFQLGRRYVPATQWPHLVDLGVESFRDDVDADAFVRPTDRQPVGQRLDRLSDVVADGRLRPVLILRGARLEGDPEPRYAPRSDAERERFAAFSAEVVRSTRAHRPFYEIWNEWNMGWRERSRLRGLLPGKENPDFSPESYVAMSKAAYASIKAVDPAATVLTGAIGDDEDWAWTRRALKAGLAETGDAISVHVYNHCKSPSDRTAEDLIGKAEEFHDVVSEETGGRAPPLYITEFGWPNDNAKCGIPLDLAAANFAQFSLWASTVDWVKGVWAYELRNSGSDPAEPEDNFGLYTYDDRPKPAACAYREAIALVREMSDRRFREAPEGIRWLEGRSGDGKRLWAIWTTGRDAAGTIAFDASKPHQMKTLCGSASTSAAAMPIGPMPLIVRDIDDMAAAGVTLELDD